MQLYSFLKVMDYLKRIADNGSIPEGYKKLETLLSEGSRKGSEIVPEQLAEARDQLIMALQEFDPEDLGYLGTKMISAIDGSSVVGSKAVAFLRGIGSEELNYKTLHAEISRKSKALGKLTGTASSFYSVFQDFIQFRTAAVEEEVSSGVLLNLYFEKDVSIHDIQDVVKYTRLWDEILQSFTGLTGSELREIQSCSINEKSALLGIRLDKKSMDLLMEGTEGVLELMEQIIKVKKIKEELAMLNLQTDYGEKLDREIEQLVDSEARTIAASLMDRSENTGLAHEEAMKQELIIALKKIFSFIEKGGKLEFDLLDNTAKNRALNKLLLEIYDRISLVGNELPADAE
ncbi:MAG: hypothetical protein ACOYXB_13935 [Bacteroidota bacterium]